MNDFKDRMMETITGKFKSEKVNNKKTFKIMTNSNDVSAFK